MSQTTYSIPKSAAPKLEALVDQIVARPGDLIDVKRLEEQSAQLDISRVIDTLPEGISREDFVGILKLAMLTECATDSYAAVFQEGAEKYDAPWLDRFNQTVWVPDEYTHHTPYKYMLLSLGYTEEELEEDDSAEDEGGEDSREREWPEIDSGEPIESCDGLHIN